MAVMSSKEMNSIGRPCLSSTVLVVIHQPTMVTHFPAQRDQLRSFDRLVPQPLLLGRG